jgi:hypothetical protein
MGSNYGDVMGNGHEPADDYEKDSSAADAFKEGAKGCCEKVNHKGDSDGEAIDVDD